MRDKRGHRHRLALRSVEHVAKEFCDGSSSLVMTPAVNVTSGAANTSRYLSALVVRESGLLRDLRADRLFLRVGAAGGGDTSHVKRSFVKLRRCAGSA
jgi:hypothetical protein